MALCRQVLETVSVDRIRSHIRALEGVRHPLAAPETLERAADYIGGCLRSLGYEMVEQVYRRTGHGDGLPLPFLRNMVKQEPRWH